MKGCKKYRKLKLIICMCMRNFDESKKLISEFQD